MIKRHPHEKERLIGMKKKKYDKLMSTGMFYEWYPNATGIFHIDTMRTDEHMIWIKK